MSLARIAPKKKSLHTFHEHPFLINYKKLCHFRAPLSRCETDLGTARVCKDSDNGGKVPKSSDHIIILHCNLSLRT